MPPGRRKSGNPSVSTRNAAAQSTLSFNSKSVRVTKPSAADASTKNISSKISEAELGEAVNNVHSEDLDLEPEVAEVPIRPQAKPVAVKDEAEEKAEKIANSQLKRYWKAEEDKRKAPRGTNRYIQDYFGRKSHFRRQPQTNSFTSFSAPRTFVYEREDTAPLRSILPIRTLYRDTQVTTVEASLRARAESPARSACSYITRAKDQQRQRRDGVY
jgi:hypothetical protein